MDTDSNAEAVTPTDSRVLAEELRSILPKILWRSKWPTYQCRYGVPFEARSLANMAAMGTGPPCKHLGRRTYYLSADFCDWLETR